MTTALLERAGKFTDTLTEKIIIGKDTPAIPMTCSGIGEPCESITDCCPLLGIRICAVGICIV
ncbi:hypothetical protein ACFWAT_01255 [Streptomyces syringium]|uniref:hypothetical protein n=1 Tax=Streptomyces syringium TaxID=76729 RepID=UPI00366287B6